MIDGKDFMKTINTRLNQLRDSMTRLNTSNKQTAAKIGGIGSVGWIGNAINYTKLKTKINPTSKSINLRWKFS